MADRVSIKDLVPGTMKKKLVGLVIAKFDKRSFPDKKEYGVMRYQLSFTIRDGIEDFINVACWGSEHFITNINNSFETGSEVEISDFLVRSKSNNEYEDKYNPSTPSAYQISVSETYSKVLQYNGIDYGDLSSSLSNQPIRAPDDYYTLGDILSNGQRLNGTLVNIMACVRDAGQIKEFTSKTGREMIKREILLYDEYCQSFPLLIWDKEVALSVNNLISPYNTPVVFLVDVKVSYDEFRQKMIASVTSKTVITVNPYTEQGKQLLMWAVDNQYQPNYAFDDNTDDVHSISDVYTLEQLLDKLTPNDEMSMLSTPFSGIVYATVSHFDLDKDSNKYVINRCGQCKRRVDPTTSMCSNAACINNQSDNLLSLEFRLSLSDHTAGAESFLLARENAERVLDCNIDSFCSMDESSKTQLKWKILFERFKVFFKAFPAGQERQKPFLNILDMQSPNDFMTMVSC